MSKLIPKYQNPGSTLGYYNKNGDIFNYDTPLEEVTIRGKAPLAKINLDGTLTLPNGTILAEFAKGRFVDKDGNEYNPVVPEYRSAFDGNNASGYINLISPTLHAGAALRANSFGDYLTRVWEGNNGIVTDRFALEHPNWSALINVAGDVATLGFAEGYRYIPETKEFVRGALGRYKELRLPTPTTKELITSAKQAIRDSKQRPISSKKEGITTVKSDKTGINSRISENEIHQTGGNYYIISDNPSTMEVHANPDLKYTRLSDNSIEVAGLNPSENISMREFLQEAPVGTHFTSNLNSRTAALLSNGSWKDRFNYVFRGISPEVKPIVVDGYSTDILRGMELWPLRFTNLKIEPSQNVYMRSLNNFGTSASKFEKYFGEARNGLNWYFRDMTPLQVRMWNRDFGISNFIDPDTRLMRQKIAVKVK